MSVVQQVQDYYVPTVYNGIRDFVYKYWIRWYFRSQQQELLFIYLGQKKSGKTTAIKSTFGIHPAMSEAHTQGAWCQEYTSKDGRNRIVEVAPIKDFIHKTYNATILSSLHKYVAQNPVVPTLVFITAPLTDNRHSGSSSEFALFLKSIRLLQDVLTDQSCLNIVLVLTYADNPSVKRNLDENVTEYKDTFQNVFGTDPMCILLGDIKNEGLSNVSKASSLREKLESSDCNGFQGLLLDFLESLSNEGEYSSLQNGIETFSNEMRPIPETAQLSHLEKILSKLSNDQIEENHSSIRTSSNHNYEPNITEHYFLKANSFGEFKAVKKLNDSKRNLVYNLVEHKSKILLYNKKYLPVQNCFLGQKVLTAQQKVGVVTTYVPIYGNDFHVDGKILFTRINMVEKTTGTETKSNLSVAYRKKPNKDNFEFRRREEPRKLARNLTNVLYYYIEVNSGNDQFIVDDFVHYSKAPYTPEPWEIV